MYLAACDVSKAPARRSPPKHCKKFNPVGHLCYSFAYCPYAMRAAASQERLVELHTVPDGAAVDALRGAASCRPQPFRRTWCS
jgi:hypothetical protein